VAQAVVINSSAWTSNSNKVAGALGAAWLKVDASRAEANGSSRQNLGSFGLVF
jgi:hypothetical protein